MTHAAASGHAFREHRVGFFRSPASLASLGSAVVGAPMTLRIAHLVPDRSPYAGRMPQAHEPASASLPAPAGDPWFERSFSFDFPVGRLPIILDRLRGTVERIKAKTFGASAQSLTRRPGETWSAQEHVGHLHDLEELHLRRLDDLERGVATLSTADLANRATWDANHNARSFAEVLANFERRRAELIDRLRRWDVDRLSASATHPRLRQPMRVVDLAYFAAEHDDYHLAKMQVALDLANGERGSVSAPAPPRVARWEDLPRDAPMALLERERIVGERVMISRVHLRKGCDVPTHAHFNEQISCVLSGRIRFTLANGQRDLGTGEVLHLPANAPHGAFALEDAVVLDVFAPPSATTGIDRTDATASASR